MQVRKRRRQARAAHAHALLDRLRPDVHLAPRPAAVPVDARRPRSRWATPTPTNFRYLNHFFEIDQAQSTARARRDPAPLPGHPVGQHDRRRLDRRRLLRRHRASRTCPTRRRSAATRALGHGHVPAARPAGARRLALACDWDSDPDAVEPGIFGPSHLPSLFRDDYVTNSNDSYWLSNPEQPLEGFARIIGDERTARSLRTRIGPADRGRPGSRTRAGSRCRAAAGRGVRRPPVRRRAVRDELVAICEATRLPARTGRSTSASLPVLRAWDLHDNLDSNGRAPVPALRDPRLLGARPARARPGSGATPFDATDPVQHAARAQHRQPGVAAGARATRSTTCAAGNPARRAAARAAVREARRREDPDPRRAGRPAASSTRSTSAGCRARATRTCRTARAS